ncbi:MFS transporter [Dactylosporangium sp. NPDC051485]|uniref:MFS transporter n=1 Tax=Dactylosporangium sp. NPDC051485 TaxID=3154846 RepID=UPI0034159BE2
MSEGRGLPTVSGPDESAQRSATIRQTLANREYAAVFTAQAQSVLGDNVARAAIVALIYGHTRSPVVAAAAFAVSYLPWLGLGAVLTAWAERHPYRRTMIGCDVLRAGIMLVLAVFPHAHSSVLIALLFFSALLAPPFDSSRSALMPRLLHGEQYVTAITLNRTTAQLALICGYGLGALLVSVNDRAALVFNAVTFAISAVIVSTLVKEYPPSLKAEQHTGLLREALDGYRIVFRSQVMRSIALVVFCGVSIGVIPEGLAAAWAAHLAGNKPDTFGFGVIMIASAVGFVVGSALVTWQLRPQRRIALIRPVAIVTPLALVPALLDPDLVVVAVMTVVAGASLAITMPAGNGLFVQVLPPAYRARAFGVMQSGVHLCQGAAALISGWLASYYALPAVVGYFAIGGAAAMALIIAAWPSKASIADAIAANKVVIAAEQHAAAAGPGRIDEFGEVTIDLGRAPLPARRRPSPGPSERTVDLSERTAELGGLPPPPPSQAARHS